MDFFEIVGQNIADVLEEKGITQKQLAEQIGVSKQVMNKIVRGQKAINTLEVKMIADALGATIERLVQERGDSWPEASKHEEMLPIFMGQVRSEEAKQGLVFLNKVIREICTMEEVLKDE